MIECFTITTAFHFGDALAQMFALRHRIFIENEGYEVPSWNGMEFDAYDTPAAIYGLWRDKAGVARGILRLNPTLLPYMIETVWPHSVTAVPLPKSARVWEATRCGIDPALPGEMRERVTSELMLAYQEIGLMLRAEAFIAIGERHTWDRMCGRKGWPLQVIGPIIEHQRWRMVPVLMPIAQDVLARMRRATGIHGPVLQTPASGLAMEASAR